MKNNLTTLSKVGKYYGLSSIAVGKILTQKGYRDEKTSYPTEQIINNKLAYKEETRNGYVFFLWKEDFVCNILEQNGYVGNIPKERIIFRLAYDVGNLIMSNPDQKSIEYRRAIHKIRKHLTNNASDYDLIFEYLKDYTDEINYLKIKERFAFKKKSLTN